VSGQARGQGRDTSRTVPTVTHRAQANGRGRLTAGQLLDLLHELAEGGVPASAPLTITAGQDPRDHDWSWQVVATW